MQIWCLKRGLNAPLNHAEMGEMLRRSRRDLLRHAVTLLIGSALQQGGYLTNVGLFASDYLQDD
jgi:hypothetical protein